MTGIMIRIETNTQLVKIHISLLKEFDEGEVKDMMLKYISDCWRRGDVMTWNLRV